MTDIVSCELLKDLNLVLRTHINKINLRIKKKKQQLKVNKLTNINELLLKVNMLHKYHEY